MTPDFLITGDGLALTAQARDRLVELRVTDEEGFSADRFEIELDDRDSRLEWPETGADVEISLGYRGAALTPLGQFTIDSVSGTGPLLKMRIGGKAADMAGQIRAPRTRAWEDKTLSEIVEAIAGEHGLTAAVHESLRALHWPYLAQTSESDLHFLTRITRPLDAIAKPAGGRLVVTKRGASTNAEGEEIPPAGITTSQLSTYSWQIGEREDYKSVEAEWQETAAGKTRLERAGSGEPVKKLRHIFGSAEEARRAAEGHLSMAGRAAMTFRGQGWGFLPELMAGGPAEITAARPELGGSWYVTRVVHVLASGGLKTEFTAQKAAPEGDS